MKNKVTLISCIIILFSSILFINNIDKGISNFEDCEILLKNNNNAINSERNVVECYNLVAIKYSNLKTPQDALKYFKNYLKNTKYSDQIDCHNILHSIGASFYDTFKNKALIPNIELCLYGYYHGIFQKADKTTNNYNQFLSIICENKKEENLNLCKAAVSHGYGHSLSSTFSSLSEAFINCDLIISKIEIEKENCAYGVIMERYNTNEKINLNSCLNNNSSDIAAGCLLGLGQHSLKNSVNFNDSCPVKILNKLFYEKCTRGLGFAIASSLLYNLNNKLPNNEYIDNMIKDCSSNVSCSSGAGSILTSTVRNLNNALSYCVKYFVNKDCKDSAIKTARLENIT